ncbi:MAG: hypothetical protein Tp136SUR676911_7 [Prokaryotic dsDNA virus sp.]|jgi:hypothetical protein|nr:MAG: hypothetical protein Tp136SUR676911_7 [Prokaryotic dsDNA virus sp.]|tara:strand:+ start:3662 stop:4801 length:1140 start_codon:yes stop_codon:yes gene_type:complete
MSDFLLDYHDIEPQMRGQWEGFIANETGIDAGLEGRQRGKNGECPICGGNDRAHFREHDGRVFLFCRGGCGNTDSTWGSNTCSTPEYLCMTIGGYDFSTLVERCAEWLGMQVPERKSSSAAKISPVNSKPKAFTTPDNKKPFYKSPEDYEKAQKEATEDSSSPSVEPTQKQPSKTTKFVNVNDAMALSEVVAWHRIGYCAKNAVTGSEGEFLSIKRGEQYNLLVPLFLDTTRRVVLVGAVEIDSDGKVMKYGSCGGAYATLDGDSDMRVFCTDYATALRINREAGCKCYYSPTPSAFKKTDANYCYINSYDHEVMHKATAFYGQKVEYIIPSAWIKGFFDEQSYRSNSLIQDKLKGYRIMTYDECQQYIKEFEDAEVQA